MVKSALELTRRDKNSLANKVRNRVRSDCKYVQADLSKMSFRKNIKKKHKMIFIWQDI